MDGWVDGWRQSLWINQSIDHQPDPWDPRTLLLLPAEAMAAWLRWLIWEKTPKSMPTMAT